MVFRSFQIINIKKVDSNPPFTCPDNVPTNCLDTNSSAYTYDIILSWDIYADPSKQVIITNFFNITQQDFFELQQNDDGTYNGLITILTSGKYQIAVCNTFRAYQNCLDVCGGSIPNLYIYKSGKKNDIVSNSDPLCLDIICNEQCASKNNYQLETHDTLYFKLENHDSKLGTGYYKGYISLKLKK